MTFFSERTSTLRARSNHHAFFFQVRGRLGAAHDACPVAIAHWLPGASPDPAVRDDSRVLAALRVESEHSAGTRLHFAD